MRKTVKHFKKIMMTPIHWHWHSICLIVFLGIVSFDMMWAPIYIEYMNSQTTADQMITESLKFSNPTDQIAALQLLDKQRTWQPHTLEQGGLFYAAFGAILGIGAWKRTVKDPTNDDDDDDSNVTSSAPTNPVPAPAPSPTTTAQ